MPINSINSNQMPSKNAPNTIGEGEKNAKGPTAAAGANAIKAAANAYSQVARTPTVKDAANVQISPKAKEMSLAKKIVDETPDVREDKVAKFKELIAKGEYKPSADKITEGILKEALKDELSKTPEVALE